MNKVKKVMMIKNVPIPLSFTMNRNIRRFNMVENDRKIFFAFNVLSIFLFSLPIIYMSKVNYKGCQENEILYQKLYNSTRMNI
ncbi:conserved Plasmodium protein, unknown function [Plasmodium sp. gorilla clade G1]|nr:conserved Plasmodium protein, unknown function [Plasmodium sp. gorilla clade G1]